MKRVRYLLVGVVLLAALSGRSAAGLSIGLGVSSDPFYGTVKDSSVVPVVACVLAELELGDAFALQVRAGYAGFERTQQSQTNLDLDTLRVNGGIIEVVPGFRIPTPFKWIEFRAGVGLAGTYHSTVDRRMQYENYPHGYLAVDDIWGAGQTFVGALRFQPTRRVALDLRWERQGLGFTWTASRTYTGSGSRLWWLQASRTDEAWFGWSGQARTTLGAELLISF